MKTFAIDKIGIEFEFSVREGFEMANRQINSLVKKYNNDTFTIDVDREYYPDQIEFKLRSTANKLEGITHFQKFLREAYKKINCISGTTSQHYVGTHIHLFLVKDGKPYNEFARGKKIALTEYAYRNMGKFLKDSIGVLSRRTLLNEASRLCRNHNILRYFDADIGNVFKRNLESFGWGYQQFHEGTDRVKYQPVLWSLANPTSGKPHSLEIRCIPNSFYLTQSAEMILGFIDGFEDILNIELPQDKDEFNETLIKSLSNTHIELIKIAKCQ